MATQAFDKGGNVIYTPAFDAAFSASILTTTPVATPTATVVLQGGAAVSRIKYIYISGIATTAGNMNFQLIRWSTAGTPGSAVLTAFPSIAKHCSPNRTATAIPAGAQSAPTLTVSTVGTANYTTMGTTSGIARTGRTYLNIVTTGASTPIVWQFGDKLDQPFDLNGTTDYAALVCDGGAVPAGGKLDYTIQWDEASV